MQKLATILFFFGYSCLGLSQESNSKQSFYIGLSSVSTFTTSEINVDDVAYIDTLSYNPLDFGIYCGNEFSIGEKFILDLEFFYLNNKVEISRNQNKRFELHQNIGCLLKPGIVINQHRLLLNTGITAVYVFDKDEEFGNQYDRFDQALFIGAAYDYRLNQNISIQISYLHAKFNSISHFTQNVLKQFSIASIGVFYHLE